MKRFGTISYNIYCNFTNYGSALQTWALHQAIQKAGHTPVLVDYCPDILADKDPLNPFGHMWDQDEQSKRMVELTMPAIRENYRKFDAFYRDRFLRTAHKYTSANFDCILKDEALDGFVCGSDTIFCPDEFGFDDGYYANYPSMRGRSVSYAASFGDPHFTEESYQILRDHLQNFKALGIRENQMLPFIHAHTKVPAARTIDPTLLLTAEEYEPIIAEPQHKGDYLLLYARRYSPAMEAYAEDLARRNGWKIIDISLRAINAERGHIMAYAAGVEEFLSLVKHAQYVVTNSFHGMIFSVQFRRPFVIFSREQCDNKIEELLKLFGLPDRILVSGDESFRAINYDEVFGRLETARAESTRFLEMELAL
ncbi:MAG: polysaccharide pyruvyl transferase family protein [Oscillospiraceae bacterium]|nr:polysaccharide pyruvyl transferase family protein [Oscillospiraceae bacterium]